MQTHAPIGNVPSLEYNMTITRKLYNTSRRKYQSYQTQLSIKKANKCSVLSNEHLSRYLDLDLCKSHDTSIKDSQVLTNQLAQGRHRAGKRSPQNYKTIESPYIGSDLYTWYCRRRLRADIVELLDPRMRSTSVMRTNCSRSTFAIGLETKQRLNIREFSIICNYQFNIYNRVLLEEGVCHFNVCVEILVF